MNQDRIQYSFVADLSEQGTDFKRSVKLVIYPTDSSVELHDLKGSKGRQVNILDYADNFTRGYFEWLNEQGTILLLVKPAAYHDTGRILERLQDRGHRPRCLKMFRLTRPEASEFASSSDQLNQSTFVDDVCSDAVLVGEFACNDTARTVPAEPRSVLAGVWESFGDNIYVSHIPGTASSEKSFFFGNRHFKPTALFSHCALCIIKPHAMPELSGKMIQTLLDSGFEISAMDLRCLSLNDVRALYGVYQGVITDFEDTCHEMSSGPSLLIQVRQEDVVRKLRKLVGPIDPEIARKVAPTTLRAQFGVDRARNAVHCTDLDEDGIRECEYFFK